MFQSRLPDQTVQSAETRQHDKLAQAKILYGEYASREKMNLRTAWEIGRLLAEAKDDAGHGNWTEALAKTGIPQQTASRWARLSNYSLSDLSRFSTIGEALESLKEKPEDAGASEEESFLKPQQEAPPKKKAEVFCKRCIRIGTAVANCQGCLDARAAAKKREDKAAAKKAGITVGGNGKLKPSEPDAPPALKEAEALIDKLLRHVDDVEGPKETPYGEGCRRLLGEVLESIKSLYKKIKRCQN